MRQIDMLGADTYKLLHGVHPPTYGIDIVNITPSILN